MTGSRNTLAWPRGFTLIEVMITVAIVGILAAVALPAYSGYVTRSRIIEATAKLSDYRVKMEQYYLDNRTYAGAGTACGVPDPTYVAGKDYFLISCAGASATAFEATATGQGGMTGFAYTINEADVRKTTAAPSTWTTSSTCWAVRKNGECS